MFNLSNPSFRSVEEIQRLREIRKALQANDGATTDIAQLQDGSALGQQFLDKTMVSIVSSEPHFRFLKQAPRRDVDQIIAEYNKYKSHGSSDAFRRNAFVAQGEDPKFDDVILKRLWDNVTFLAVGYRFNKVITKIRNTQDPEVVNSTGALRGLLENLSMKIWHGDKTLNSLESNGFVRTVSSVSTNHVVDCRGVLPELGLIADRAAFISGKFFGVPNQMWMPIGTRNLFNQVYQQSGNAYVFQNNSNKPDSVGYGNIITHLNVSEALNSRLELEVDRWMDLSNVGVSRIFDRATETYVEAPSGADAPVLPTFTNAVGALATSQFAAGDVGTYEYRISAVRLGQESIASPLQSVAIAAGQAVTLTITPGVGGSYATSFRIYRKDPNSTEHLFMKEVMRDTVNPTTTVIDKNDDLPGTSCMVLGDFNAISTTDELRTFVLSELLPVMKTLFEPGIGAGLRQQAGMIEYYCVPQILAPEKFVIFKNVPVRSI